MGHLTATAVESERARYQGSAYDTWLYRDWHLIECCINKPKGFRRNFSRFDKVDRSYLGFIQFVCALNWLR